MARKAFVIENNTVEVEINEEFEFEHMDCDGAMEVQDVKVKEKPSANTNVKHEFSLLIAYRYNMEDGDNGEFTDVWTIIEKNNDSPQLVFADSDNPINLTSYMAMEMTPLVALNGVGAVEN